MVAAVRGRTCSRQSPRRQTPPRPECPSPPNPQAWPLTVRRYLQARPNDFEHMSQTDWCRDMKQRRCRLRSRAMIATALPSARCRAAGPAAACAPMPYARAIETAIREPTLCLAVRSNGGTTAADGLIRCWPTIRHRSRSRAESMWIVRERWLAIRAAKQIPESGLFP
jgi:hypothetical protein